MLINAGLHEGDLISFTPADDDDDDDDDEEETPVIGVGDDVEVGVWTGVWSCGMRWAISDGRGEAFNKMVNPGKPVSTFIESNSIAFKVTPFNACLEAISRAAL